LIDMDIKVVIALNMYDELQKNKDEFDFISLGKMIGIPIIPTVGAKGGGIRELFNKIINVYNDREPIVRHIHINYGKEIEKSIERIQAILKTERNFPITDKISSRFLALKLLEKDKRINKFILNSPDYNHIIETADAEIRRLENEFRDTSDTLIAELRYGFISGALKETFRPNVFTKRKTTEIIDSFFTHKLIGFPVFILFMFIMFSSTFNLGEYPMNWIEFGVEKFSMLMHQILPEGSFKDLLIDGIIGGVGGVIVFLPNILILFFFISLMEDTGYMARVVFIMDKLMHKIGLHGKSFIPLIMGFGCNVPAIMATRTIENRNNRLLTILINPFMSCSARLPVYVLLIGAIFPDFRGTMLFLLYFIGILLAIVVAVVFKKLIFKGEEAPFVMELPPYRMPTLKSIIRHMWFKGAQYLKKMGGVILIASILIWALGYFPRNVEYSVDYNKEISKVESRYKEKLAESKGESNLALSAEKENEIQKILLDRRSEHHENSYIGILGKSIEPVIRPLGFDWKMGVALATGIAAKEVVVSTLGVLYHTDENNESSITTLSEKLQQEKYTKGTKKGEKVYTPLATFTYLLFVLIYFPCVAVVAAIHKESGNWKWALFAVGYTTGLAYIISLVVYQVGNLLGF
ncbi:MAG: ferrous iron transport protein B, partial [Bacteroidales bacterium]|nr:ferrous iron transport protein B [Bacteroidales bacterium]